MFVKYWILWIFCWKTIRFYHWKCWCDDSWPNKICSYVAVRNNIVSSKYTLWTHLQLLNYRDWQHNKCSIHTTSSFHSYFKWTSRLVDIIYYISPNWIFCGEVEEKFTLLILGIKYHELFPYFVRISMFLILNGICTAIIIIIIIYIIYVHFPCYHGLNGFTWWLFSTLICHAQGLYWCFSFWDHVSQPAPKSFVAYACLHVHQQPFPYIS